MNRPPVVSVASGLVRPRWRGVLHTWAFVASIPAAIVLLVLADDTRARVGVAVYGVCLIAVFGVSAGYHRLARTVRAQELMQRLDHATIFLMIAGTYTPVCLVVLPMTWWIPLLAVVWTGAVIGVGMKLIGTPRLSRWGTALYLVLGWSALVAIPRFVVSLTPAALGLMVLGGVLYTIGAVCFLLKRPDPLPRVFGYHEVWHAFTVLAGVAHFSMVAAVAA